MISALLEGVSHFELIAPKIKEELSMNIEKILDKTNSDKKVEAYFPLLIKFILKEQMRKFRCKQVGGIVQLPI